MIDDGGVSTKTVLAAPATTSLLLVEDDDATADLVKRSLLRAGFSVVRAATERWALEKLATQSFGAILLDYGLPGGDPWRVVEAAQQKKPEIPVIIVTGVGSEGIAAQAVHRGIADYVIKNGEFWKDLPALARRVINAAQLEQERTRAEAQFRALLESAPDAMVIADQEDKIVLVNAETERLFGYSRGELLGRSVRLLLTEHVPNPPSSGDSMRPSGAGIEVTALRKDGVTVPVEIRLSPLFTEEGELVVRAIRDVSERQHQRDQRFLLRFGERLYAFTESGALIQFVVQQLATYMGAAHCTFTEFDEEKNLMTVLGDARTDEKSMSGKSIPLTGLPAGLYADHQSGRVLSMSDAKTDPRTAAAFEATFSPLGIRSYISAPLMRDGAWVAALAIVDASPRTWTLRETQILQAASERAWLWVEHLRMLRALRASVSELQVISGDLELRVEQRTRELQDSLREKEALLKEVHHRVKNNLQVISSLLKLQALHLPDPKARAMFAESQARVQSIALVHEKLYQAKNLSNIPFNDYVHSLVVSLLHAQNADGRGISANLDIAPIHLSVEHAIPCGLILNELVTNSLKHAFPGGRPGSIHVTLRRIDGAVQLIVADDGVGLPDRIEPRELASLGLDLVFTFAEQIEAKIDIRRSPGTEFRLSFREETVG
ncbi:MAG: histidine kinase dimerization/phosphoacceptor domain -containing protein [Polyangiaceae bacterium]